MPNARIHLALFGLVAAATLLPAVSGGVALFAGLVFALTVGNPCVPLTRRWTPVLLQLSVVGLGAAMNLLTVAAVGRAGAVYTAVGISGALLFGILLGKVLRIERTVTVLISAGTAICGGSAIAAVAPVIGAKDPEVSVSLATVFFLNASALFFFPWVGHWAGFSQDQFGLWSALAIHDTSSVVGAAMQYGARALEVATTVKLARALWIVPMTLVIGLLWTRGGDPKAPVKAKKPWFILGFVLMAALITWVPELRPAGHALAEVAKRSMVLTLFLIGSGLSRATLRSVGLRPFIQGVLLWFAVGSLSFAAISSGWVTL